MFIYVTPNGRRYHKQMMCSGLANATLRREVIICDECLGQLRGTPKHLCVVNTLMVAHREGSACANRLHGLGLGKRFGPCRLCVTTPL